MAVGYVKLLESFEISHLYIVCVLVGYVLAGPDALRVWIATKNAPQSPTAKVKPPPITLSEKALRRLKALAYTLWSHSLIVGLLVYKPESQFLKFLLINRFVWIFCTSIGVVIWTGSGLVKTSVHRNDYGVPVERLIRPTRNTKRFISVFLGSIIISVVIALCTLLTNYRALNAFATIALIFKHSRHPSYGTISMRRMITIFLGLSTSLTVVGAIVVSFLFNAGRNEELFGSIRIPTEYAPLISFWIYDRAWIFQVLYAHLPGWLITISLRFDYQLYLNSSNVPNDLILSNVPAPESRCASIPTPNVGEGILIPSQTPIAFIKVYYTTALVAWVLSQFVAIYINASTKLSLGGELGFTAFTLLLELPIICLALLIVAVIRHEWRALWTYKEDWIVRPWQMERPTSEATVSIPADEHDKEAGLAADDKT